MPDSAFVWTAQRVFPSVRGSAKTFIDEMLAQLHQARWSEHDVFGIHLAVEEAVVNAIKHGNRLDGDKSVHVDCRLTPDRFWIEIVDEGPGFKPEDVADCTADENLCTPCGRGLMLMRSFMSRVAFNETGNRVVMEKVASSAAGQQDGDSAASNGCLTD